MNAFSFLLYTVFCSLWAVALSVMAVRLHRQQRELRSRLEGVAAVVLAACAVLMTFAATVSVVAFIDALMKGN